MKKSEGWMAKCAQFTFLYFHWGGEGWRLEENPKFGMEIIFPCGGVQWRRGKIEIDWWCHVTLLRKLRADPSITRGLASDTVHGPGSCGAPQPHDWVGGGGGVGGVKLPIRITDLIIIFILFFGFFLL